MNIEIISTFLKAKNLCSSWKEEEHPLLSHFTILFTQFPVDVSVTFVRKSLIRLISSFFFGTFLRFLLVTVYLINI